MLEDRLWQKKGKLITYSLKVGFGKKSAADRLGGLALNRRPTVREIIPYMGRKRLWGRVDKKKTSQGGKVVPKRNWVTFKQKRQCGHLAHPREKERVQKFGGHFNGPIFRTEIGGGGFNWECVLLCAENTRILT